MTGSPPALDDQEAKKVTAKEESRRQGLFDRLRKIAADAREVEQLLVDDFAQTDREIHRRG